MSDSTLSGSETAIGKKPLISEQSPANASQSHHDAASPSGTLSDYETVVPSNPTDNTASDFNAAAADLVGPVIETVDLSLRYDVGDRIGGGGMGDVYRGHDRKLNRAVAIKRLKSQFAADAKQLQRFVNEARTIAALDRHANIIQVFDYGRDLQGPFLILEFIDGESLAKRLSRGPLELQEAIHILAPICDAVAFAHSHNVFHRDIKPGNIMIGSNGIPKLGDFGIAKQSEVESGTTTGSMLGTLPYMSPEQIKDSTLVDGRSEIWSLACTLYEALTSHSPLHPELQRLPTNVREIVGKARRIDPNDRFATVDDFSGALRSLIAEKHQTSPDRQLQEGECPKCHTVNPLGRKFCKTHGCGAPLYEECPKCETHLPVWDAICGECGADVPATWTALAQDVDAKSQQFESHLAEYRFDDAEGVLTEIMILKGARWKEWRTWAESSATQLQQTRKEQEGLRDQLFEIATAAMNASKYEEVCRLLDQIPKSLHTTKTQSLASCAKGRQAELEAVVQELRSLVQFKRYGELRVKIDRVLELSPGDQRVTKLDRQLRDRELQEIREQKERQQKEEEARQLEDRERQERMTRERKERQQLEKEGQQIRKTEPLKRIRQESDGAKGSRRESADSSSKNSGVQIAQTASKSKSVIVVATVVLGVITVVLSIFLFGPSRSTEWERASGTGKKLTHAELIATVPVGRTVLPSDTSAVKPGERRNLTIEGVGFAFRWIPPTTALPGKFLMGTPTNEDGHQTDESQVEVTLTQGFWMLETEVTQQMYFAATKAKPWTGRINVKEGDAYPACYISWTEANDFCEKLTKAARSTGVLSAKEKITLPTEPQWEWAARAGSTTAYLSGNNSSKLGDFAWYEDNAWEEGEQYAHQAGLKKPNAWGLLDISGNVWEWTSDYYDNVLPGGTNPSGPSAGSSRVLRGGSFFSLASLCRVGYRYGSDPTLVFDSFGFRAVCVSE